jgi:hypothetical protein
LGSQKTWGLRSGFMARTRWESKRLKRQIEQHTIALLRLDLLLGLFLKHPHGRGKVSADPKKGCWDMRLR